MTAKQNGGRLDFKVLMHTVHNNFQYSIYMKVSCSPKPPCVHVVVNLYMFQDCIISLTYWHFTVQHPHVCGLVDGLGSSVLSTATSSAALLVSALQRGWLDLPSLLSTLVSQAALMLHYPVAVHAITNALLWEVKVLQLQKGYQCPYSLK